MSAHGVHVRLITVGLASALSVLSTGTSSFAADTSSVRRGAAQRLDRAHDLIEQKNYEAAVAALDEMATRGRLTDREAALMWQAYGYAYSSTEQYERAAESFEKCLDTNGLEERAALNIRYNLAQLYLMMEQPEKAVELFLEWFERTENPAPKAHYLMALAYMQAERVHAAIPHAEQAVARVELAHESWLQLLLTLYFEEKRYAESVPILEELVERFPKKTYWKQLSAVHAQLGHQKKALAAVELAYLQGLLTEESELLNLAQLYLYNDLPYRAAKVMEESLASDRVEPDADAWQILADSWIQARERAHALEPLEKAAELSDRGDLYVRLGQIHIGEERWPQAIDALQKARRKGHLREAGYASLFLGIAYANDGQWERAEKALQEAGEHESTEKAATAWLSHLEREKALQHANAR